ncbi:hypothetical protein F5Y18DRAFT_378388 [Xylariaceae sp. FL1019]|nr:hypothetical protein F5Y18DRAFT_378388 [Xylariaceae sp. FL1019]
MAPPKKKAKKARADAWKGEAAPHPDQTPTAPGAVGTRLINGYFHCQCGTFIKYGKDNYNNHWRRTHSDAPKNGYTESRENIPHRCGNCGKTYKNHNSLRSHRRQKHGHRGDSTMLKNFTPVKGRAYNPHKAAKTASKKRAAPESDSDDAEEDEDEVDYGSEWEGIMDDEDEDDEEPGAGGNGHGHDGGIGGAQAVQLSF